MMDLVKALSYGLEFFGLYYGTYRGQVMANNDPNNSGRVIVHCPSIHGTSYPNAWAWPISSMGGVSSGIWHVPDVGEWVHVRFDHGRLDFPMWEGGWWGNGDTTPDMIPTRVVMCTKEGLKIVLDRSAKSVLIQQDDGNSVLIEENKTTITATGDVAINTQGKTQINAQDDVDITTQGTVNITGDVNIVGDVTITGAGIIQPSPWSTPPA